MCNECLRIMPADRSGPGDHRPSLDPLHLKEFQPSQFRALVIVVYRRKIDDLGVNE
jgi:hypothetical protein